MVILNKFYKIKLQASSLTEVLVASVIILIVFGIAITTLDNVLYNSVKNKNHFIETTLNQLAYEYQHNKITLPYSYEEGDWVFNTIKTIENNMTIVIFEAKNTVTNKKLTKKTVVNDTE